MTDNVISSRPARPTEDRKDLLARFYREIGISAVAAALSVTTPKKPAQRDDRNEIPGGIGRDLKDLAA
jgi:hypothetical protein